MGGAEKVLIDMLTNLDHNVYSITLCLLKNENAFEHITNNLPIEIYSLNMNETIPKGWREFVKLYQLYRKIKSLNPDIIQTQGQDSDLYGQFVGIMLRIKVISMIHIEDVFRHDGTSATYRYMIKLWLENHTIHTCYKIIAISESIKYFAVNIRNMPEQRVIIIRNSVPLLKRSLPKEQAKSIYFGENGNIVIGSICRLAPQKNILLGILSFSYVYMKNNNARYIIVGDGPERNILHFYSQKLGIENAVIFTGWQKDVKPFLELFDILLITSYTEGLPLVLLEAMSICVPIVSSNINGIQELITNGYSGILVNTAGEEKLAKVISKGEPHDISSSHEFAKAIEKLISNPKYAHLLAQNARKTFEEECSLEGNVQKLQELYATATHL